MKIPFLIKDGEHLEIFESNIDPMLRFIHEKNIRPSGWIEIKKNKYDIIVDNYKNVQNILGVCDGTGSLLSKFDSIAENNIKTVKSEIQKKQ